MPTVSTDQAALDGVDRQEGSQHGCPEAGVGSFLTLARSTRPGLTAQIGPGAAITLEAVTHGAENTKRSLTMPVLDEDGPIEDGETLAEAAAAAHPASITSRTAQSTRNATKSAAEYRAALDTFFEEIVWIAPWDAERFAEATKRLHDAVMVS